MVQGCASFSQGSVTCNAYVTVWISWLGGIFMGGIGSQVGKNVRVVYNDLPSPMTVKRLAVSSYSSSSWIIPGYLYPPSEYTTWNIDLIVHSVKGRTAPHPSHVRVLSYTTHAVGHRAFDSEWHHFYGTSRLTSGSWLFLAVHECGVEHGMIQPIERVSMASEMPVSLFKLTLM